MKGRRIERWNVRDHRCGQEQRQLGPAKNDRVDVFLIPQAVHEGDAN